MKHTLQLPTITSVLHEKNIQLGRSRSFESEISGKNREIYRVILQYFNFISVVGLSLKRELLNNVEQDTPKFS
jgi:hypothetical protein